ncbi:MAG: aldo/keto reductase [Anaerolineales bacterium]|nr:aldo/keto reductase [Anaerolineales bacterium]
MGFWRPARNWGLLPYSPLGRGYLTGKVAANQTFAANNIRKGNPRFTKEAIAANWAVVDLLKQIGTSNGATPAQMALAWLLAQKPWIVPIPASRKLNRLDENLGAAEFELSVVDLGQIKEAMDKITVIGHRY